MRIPERGEKGFTLIELLIVVAILGVLAAVVIPNVSRFIGRGTDEAAATELTTIQAAVSAMMIDNNLTSLDGVTAGSGNTTWTAVNDATNDMALFPDGAAGGSHLFDYGDNTPNVNYVQTQNSTRSYWADTDGTVHQVP